MTTASRRRSWRRWSGEHSRTANCELRTAKRTAVFEVRSSQSIQLMESTLRVTSAVLMTVALLAACKGDKEEASTIQTVPVERRDIVVDAEATGVVEPINVIEVKSKASGQIERMPVETGSHVKPGDLLVQVDTRDVRNQYNQAPAYLRAPQD